MIDDLDILSVAHDALLEGRSTSDVLADAAPWARYDRLLGQDLLGYTLDALRARMREVFGPTIDLSPGTVMHSVAEIQARAVVDMWAQQEQILDALRVDWLPVTLP